MTWSPQDTTISTEMFFAVRIWNTVYICLIIMTSLTLICFQISMSSLIFCHFWWCKKSLVCWPKLFKTCLKEQLIEKCTAATGNTVTSWQIEPFSKFYIKSLKYPFLFLQNVLFSCESSSRNANVRPSVGPSVPKCF